jgi:signal peptidase I
VSSKRNSEARSWLSVAVVVGLTLMARSSLADHYSVPSGSMRPTVEIGDRIVVDKSAYGVRLPWSSVWLGEVQSPARGDVVVLASPENGKVLLKRVVAVAGDRVAVLDGNVYLGGARVVEAHRKLPGAGPAMPSTEVPAEQLLVMGDNRGNSHDGRSFGLVHERAVLGRAIAVFMRDGQLSWLPLR